MSTATILEILGISLGTMALTAVATYLVLVLLPADAFQRKPSHSGRKTAKDILLKILKNLAGAVLIAVGVALSIPGVPGQGLLTIFVGLLLVDIPGKRKLELKILRRPRIRRFVDRLRRKRGKPPFVLEGNP